MHYLANREPILTSHRAVGESTASAMDLIVNCKMKFNELQINIKTSFKKSSKNKCFLNCMGRPLTFSSSSADC